MDILITICARGGSKGIPGKNIKLLNGLPLISYTIKIAKQLKKVHSDAEIALSTDSDEIKSVAKEYGITTDYGRPESLSGDSAGKVDVIADVLAWHEDKKNKIYDYILDLDVSSPLRSLADLKLAFSMLKKNPSALNLFSVSKANRNPYFNMVEQKENGYFAAIKSWNQEISTRQSAPKVYDMNASFYIYRRCFFDAWDGGVITDRSLAYEVPHLCFDLDHEVDFEIMEYLISQDKLDFSL